MIDLTETMFQDGLVAQAAQAAVDDGTVYVSAAGNEAGYGIDALYFDSNAAADHGESPLLRARDRAPLGSEGEAETDTIIAQAIGDEGTAAAATDSASVSSSACVPELDLSNRTITGVHFEGACQTILAGPSYVVGPTGELAFEAPHIVLRDGFGVLGNGTFTAKSP